MDGGPSGDSPPPSMMTSTENLLPTLLQIFLTVTLGYLAGSLGMFGRREARGLGVFVSKLSLPALIFISLASLDLHNIKWSFLLAILISKSLVFLLVLFLDLLLSKNLSRAALFAMYSTQTNDFGIGLPILNSVFGPGHPLVGLLYLVQPISLLIINPVAFTLLEFGKGKGKDGGEAKGALATIGGVLKGLLTNPIIAMTVLGVLGNFAFSSSPPPHLSKFLSALGAAFSALAPFSLGLSMVGKLSGIKSEVVKPIAALVTVKTVITPMLTYIIVDQVTHLLDDIPDPSLSSFALLLGSFPTALGVASFATEYMVVPDILSAAIVMGTLASAPLLYLVANILTFTTVSYSGLAGRDHSWVDCIISITSCTIVLLLFLLRRTKRPPPFTWTVLLLTFLSSALGLVTSFTPLPALALCHLTALHASRLSCPALALTLLLRARESSAFTSPPSSLALLLAGPVLSLSSLLLLQTDYIPYSFRSYGPHQEHLSVAVNLLALLPTLFCLFLLSRSPHTSLAGLQVFRHSLLLLSLSLAMFTSVLHSLASILSASLGTSTFPAAFIALTCMNAVLSSGQGLLFLAVFGLDQAPGLLASLRTKLGSLYASWKQHSGIESVFMMPDSSDVELVSVTSTSATGKEQQQRFQKVLTAEVAVNDVAGRSV